MTFFQVLRKDETVQIILQMEKKTTIDAADTKKNKIMKYIFSKHTETQIK